VAVAGARSADRHPPVRHDEHLSITALLGKESPKIATATTVVAVIVVTAVVGLFIFATRRFR
jgi:hypothetical protein